MPKLYELTGAYLMLQEMLEDPDADMQCVLDTLESIGGDIKHKAECTAAIIRMLEMDAKGLQDEAKRLSDRAGMWNNRAAGLRRYLERQISKLPEKKLTTLRFTLTMRAKADVLRIDEEKFQSYDKARKKPWWVRSVSLSRTELKKAVEAGAKVPGVSIEPGGECLQIK